MPDREKDIRIADMKCDDYVIGIQCIICGSWKELTRQESQYNCRFGTTASLYVCDKCKNAVKWAKEQMEGM